MRDKYVGRPRTWRLAKELRALRSLPREVVPEARKHHVPEARKGAVPEARKHHMPEARQRKASGSAIVRGGREPVEQETRGRAGGRGGGAAKATPPSQLSAGA